jgi:hypothetical protein
VKRLKERLNRETNLKERYFNEAKDLKKRNNINSNLSTDKRLNKSGTSINPLMRINPKTTEKVDKKKPTENEIILTEVSRKLIEKN